MTVKLKTPSNGSVSLTPQDTASDVVLTVPSGGVATQLAVADSSGYAYSGGLVVSPQTGFKNRIINGDMRIDQRNNGASVTPGAAANTYTLDRWGGYNSVGSKFSVQRNAGSATPPPDFINYFGVTSLSAYTPLASDQLQVSQNIEGLNVADLNWGTANAAPVTLSFWVRSSLTGNFPVSLINSSNNRSYPFTYTINAANTWEYKTITIPGDTSGTWLKDTGTGMQLRFAVGYGSNFVGTANSWNAANVLSPSGAVNVCATNGATWYITGVQLEKGSTATPFEFRSIGQELALCQRYYQKYTYDIKGVPTLVRVTSGINEYDGSMPIPTMRASPTFATTSTQVHKPGVRSESFTVGVYTGPTSLVLDVTPATNDSTCNAAFFRDGSVTLTAEL